MNRSHVKHILLCATIIAGSLGTACQVSVADDDSDEGEGEGEGDEHPNGFIATLDGDESTYDQNVDANKFVTGGIQIMMAGSNSDDDRLLVFFPGTTAGSFSCSGDAAIMLTTGAGQYRADSTVAGSTCSVDVTEAGEVGDPIRGTFTALLKDGSEEHPASGSFDIIRGVDAE